MQVLNRRDCESQSTQDLTFFSVEGNLHLPLLCSKQRFSHLGHGGSLGVRSVKEAAGAGFLHDLRTRVTTHLTEGVITEDDCTILHLCVGNDKPSIFGWREREYRRH